MLSFGGFLAESLPSFDYLLNSTFKNASQIWHIVKQRWKIVFNLLTLWPFDHQHLSKDLCWLLSSLILSLSWSQRSRMSLKSETLLSNDEKYSKSPKHFNAMVVCLLMAFWLLIAFNVCQSRQSLMSNTSVGKLNIRKYLSLPWLVNIRLVFIYVVEFKRGGRSCSCHSACTTQICGKAGFGGWEGGNPAV